VVWKAVLLILLAVCDTSILVSHTWGDCKRESSPRAAPQLAKMQSQVDRQGQSRVRPGGGRHACPRRGRSARVWRRAILPHNQIIGAGLRGYVLFNTHIH
jgi:hypothetical protein